MAETVKIYDTTLRDGTQGEGVSFSVDDKLAITRRLAEMGVHYIEGGWPGSNVKDAEFFARARNLDLGASRLAAFGSTCHPRNTPQEDANLKALLEAETPVVTVFGKSWDLHVKKALRIGLQDNLQLIAATVAYLKSKGREVVYDAEHFFDGFAADPWFALETLRAADQAGADWIVLCDTNGGTLTSRVSEVVSHARSLLKAPIGIHTHNDSDLAVANAVAAVQAGATQVQGTINGYGERCGNANICSVVAVLELKLGRATIGRERLAGLTPLAHYVAELANLPHRSNQPFVGRSAFAHKGGIHVSAVMRDPVTYEHVDPEVTGNARRVLVSDLSGKSNVLYKAAEMGIDVSASGPRVQEVVNRIKELEHNGFEFEAAEGSLALLLEEAAGTRETFFNPESYRVETDWTPAEGLTSRATVRVNLNGRIEEASAEGAGPVHALDCALRQALSDSFQCLRDVKLSDYKVRVIDADKATAAKVRVLIRSRDDSDTWNTVGVSDNILEASWQALADAVNYKLQKNHRASAATGRTVVTGKAAPQSPAPDAAGEPMVGEPIAEPEA